MEEFEFYWTQSIVDHIYRHGVTPEEVGEVIYEGKPFVRRDPGSGQSRRFMCSGKRRQDDIYT